MNKLILSCKKATELIEKREVVGLSFIEKSQLKVHISMCKACNAYGSQSLLIDKALSRKSDEELASTEKMSDEAKAQILKKLGGSTA